MNATEQQMISDYIEFLCDNLV